MSDPIPSYSFDFGSGVAYGWGLRSARGMVVREIISSHGRERSLFHYRLDDSSIAAAVGKTLPPVLADLIDVFAAIYVADRLSPRTNPKVEPRNAPHGPRRIRLRVPVRRAALWRRGSVKEALESAGWYCTRDDWQFGFVDRQRERRHSECQSHLFGRHPQDVSGVVLHSGGLDGGIGLVDSVRRAGDRLVIGASVTTNNRQRWVQAGVVSSLRDLRDHAGWAVTVPRLLVNLLGVARRDQESSQRGRGLLYLATGTAVAVLAGHGILTLSENGVGAINLPYSPEQVGPHISRAAHPRTLALFSDFVATLLERPFTIVNSSLWRTKGEACRDAMGPGFDKIAQLSVSCDRFPWRIAGYPCGQCASCLVRRAALHAADLSRIDGAGYRQPRKGQFDALSDDLRWGDADLVPLFAVRSQVELLRPVLGSAAPEESLIGAFPELNDILLVAPSLAMPESEVKSKPVRLYRAYVAEIDGFYSMIPRAGWSHTPPIALEPSILPAAG